MHNSRNGEKTIRFTNYTFTLGGGSINLFLCRVSVGTHTVVPYNYRIAPVACTMFFIPLPFGVIYRSLYYLLGYLQSRLKPPTYLKKSKTLQQSNELNKE